MSSTISNKESLKEKIHETTETTDLNEIDLPTLYRKIDEIIQKGLRK